MHRARLPLAIEHSRNETLLRRNLAELDLIVRVHVELPKGLKLATDEFGEGWNLSRSLDVRHLEERILNPGWSLIKIDEGTLRSGVGATAQEAITSALKLALRSVSERLHAVEVERIHLTQYPWFFLARVTVRPYLIQQSTDLPVFDGKEPLPIIPSRRQPPSYANVLYPHFGGAMPQLRQILISSEESEDAIPEQLVKIPCGLVAKTAVVTRSR